LIARFKLQLEAFGYKPMGARTRIVRATGPRGVVRTKTKFQVGEIVDMVAKRRGETHAVAKVVHGACSFVWGWGVLYHLDHRDSSKAIYCAKLFDLELKPETG
jgi:hypothetical protein